MHQLDAEPVATKVIYTMTKTQPSCSRGGEQARVLNTFKKAMDLPQAARWKVPSDKDIESLEKHGIFKLIPTTPVPTGHKVVDTRPQSIRMMLAIAAELDYEVHMLDV